jgi:hypothetical protein|tara:strand:- start:12983 stop:13390 length:408 start_codon:yes stop_codon:yes gene_type:complete
MDVWRVETREGGRGPFISKAGDEAQTKAHNRGSKCRIRDMPGPPIDRRLMSSGVQFSPDHVFGFNSLNQYRDMACCPVLREELSRAGFALRRYEVATHWEGDHQIVFLKSEAVVVETKDPSQCWGFTGRVDVCYR